MIDRTHDKYSSMTIFGTDYLLTRNFFNTIFLSFLTRNFLMHFLTRNFFNPIF